VEGIDPLRSSVRIQPDCAQCHERLGRALQATNDLSGSIAELEEAIRLDPKDPKSHFELGRALRMDGRTERAMQEFAASQQLYSSHSQE
jgi:Flp pilus assembly protein TadD